MGFTNDIVSDALKKVKEELGKDENGGKELELRVKAYAQQGLTLKVKMDYNQFQEIIYKALNSSKSKYVKQWRRGIYTGFEILNQYLKTIARRAIEIQDAALLEDLANLGIVKEIKDEEKKQ